MIKLCFISFIVFCIIVLYLVLKTICGTKDYRVVKFMDMYTIERRYKLIGWRRIDDRFNKESAIKLYNDLVKERKRKSSNFDIIVSSTDEMKARKL